MIDRDRAMQFHCNKEKTQINIIPFSNAHCRMKLKSVHEIGSASCLSSKPSFADLFVFFLNDFYNLSISLQNEYVRGCFVSLDLQSIVSLYLRGLGLQHILPLALIFECARKALKNLMFNPLYTTSSLFLYQNKLRSVFSSSFTFITPIAQQSGYSALKKCRCA